MGGGRRKAVVELLEATAERGDIQTAVACLACLGETLLALLYYPPPTTATATEHTADDSPTGEDGVNGTVGQGTEGSEVTWLKQHRTVRWELAYVDLLQRLQLWHLATRVIKHSASPSVRQQNQRETIVYISCATPGEYCLLPGYCPR